MKKKTIIVMITVALICASVIAIRAISDKNENGWNGEYSEEETTMCETTSEKAPKPDNSKREEELKAIYNSMFAPSEKIDDSLIEQIKVGMTLSEAVAIIGLPQREVGYGVFEVEWDLKSGNVFHMSIDTSNHSRAYILKVIPAQNQSEEDNWVDIELSGDESWEDYCLPQQ